MLTFAIGIILLFAGAALYSRFLEKMFAPDDRKTPAVALNDGVDYVVMPTWKNSLIELLNIAGTGPIFGPIQGILFGPIAFLTIPIGNVIAGATHDYLSGMISMRNEGMQMPGLVRKYLGNGVHAVYLVILMILMILVGAVFIYTPGDLIVGSVFGLPTTPDQIAVWLAYAAIFVYYLIATLFPIDAIIGRVYPIFGAILLISAIGVFAGVILDGGKNLVNVWEPTPAHIAVKDGAPFIPVFFITVACGIMSGFHSTQAALVSRTIRSEKEGRMTFYMMMILEGFIALSWAAGAMVLYNRQPDLVEGVGAAKIVALVCREFLGNIGGYAAIVGVIVLPITSGDTALRSVRLMVAEALHIDQKPSRNRILTTAAIFIPVILILLWAKFSTNGFMMLWRYFAFTNQFVGCFALAMATVYLYIHGKNYWVALIPMLFYTFIVISYIAHAPIGLGLEARLLGSDDVANYSISYFVGAAAAIIAAVFALSHAKKHKEKILSTEPKPIY